MSVIVSVCVSMLVAQTKTLLNCRTDLGVVYQGDTDIVSVSVRSDKVRFFGFSSRQRTTRTRGKVTRYRKMDFARRRSGSGKPGSNPGGATDRDRARLTMLPCDAEAIPQRMRTRSGSTIQR